MMSYLLKFIINCAALWLVVGIVPGIGADRWETLIIASIILGVLNTFLRPLIASLTLPLEILSLGLFTLVVNGFLFALAGQLVEGFHVADFMSAVIGALLFSVISFILNLIILPGQGTRVYYGNFRRETRAKNDDVIDVEGHVTEEKDDKKIGGSDR